MARPIKYKTEDDRALALRRTVALIKEIKQTSGKTFNEISKAFVEYDLKPLKLVISESMLRHYSCGRKPMGDQRMSDAAFIAFALGWIEIKTYWDYQIDSKVISAAVHHAVEHNDKLLEKKLSLTIHELAEAGYSPQDVIILITNVLKKLSDVFESNSPKLSRPEQICRQK